MRKFASQLPGSFDFGEGNKCYLAGFEEARRCAVFVSQTVDNPDWKIGHDIENIGEEEV